MLHKTPADYGLDSYQWTADRMRTVIEQKWQVKISSARLINCSISGGCRYKRLIVIMVLPIPVNRLNSDH